MGNLLPADFTGTLQCDGYGAYPVFARNHPHPVVLAPSADILVAFGKHKKDWPVYELAFLDLMRKREIEKQIDPAVIKGGCLLCSEATPHYCHRRLIVDYLQRHWGDLTVQHLA